MEYKELIYLLRKRYVEETILKNELEVKLIRQCSKVFDYKFKIDYIEQVFASKQSEDNNIPKEFYDNMLKLFGNSSDI